MAAPRTLLGGHALHLSLGAMEKVCAAHEMPAALMAAFQTNVWKMSEACDVVSAALECSDISEPWGDLVVRVGLENCRAAAVSLLEGFFTGAEKKLDAGQAAKTTG